MQRSVLTLDEGREVIEGVSGATSKYGFHVTKYVCNHPELYQYVKPEDMAPEVKEVTAGMSSKALGICWDVDDDKFYYVSKIPCYMMMVMTMMTVKTMKIMMTVRK